MQIFIKKNEITIPSAEVIYAQNTTISVAANMREMLKTNAEKIDKKEKAQVILDTPVLMIPEDQLADENPEELYALTITPSDEEIIVLQQPIETLKVVALFAVSKDLKTVIEDNFSDYEFHSVGADLVSARGKDGRLTAHFYDNSLYAYAFKQGRLAFFNRYEATAPQDFGYLILSIWKQLGYNQLKDELLITGEPQEHDELKGILEEFVRKVSYSLSVVN